MGPTWDQVTTVFIQKWDPEEPQTWEKEQKKKETSF